MITLAPLDLSNILSYRKDVDLVFGKGKVILHFSISYVVGTYISLPLSTSYLSRSSFRLLAPTKTRDLRAPTDRGVFTAATGDHSGRGGIDEAVVVDTDTLAE